MVLQRSKIGDFLKICVTCVTELQAFTCIIRVSTKWLYFLRKICAIFAQIFFLRTFAQFLRMKRNEFCDFLRFLRMKRKEATF